VAGEIAFTVVGLGLDDSPRFDAAIRVPSHEVFAEQPPRQRHRAFLLPE
jgi:hypothetical protein